MRRSVVDPPLEIFLMKWGKLHFVFNFCLFGINLNL